MIPVTCLALGVAISVYTCYDDIKEIIEKKLQK
jgi:hypothetical protein